MRSGNIKFSHLAAEKLLKFYAKKSCYIVFGSENFQAKVRLEIEEEPVKLSGTAMDEKSKEKYLGDMQSRAGSISRSNSVRERR